MSHKHQPLWQFAGFIILAGVMASVFAIYIGQEDLWFLCAGAAIFAAAKTCMANRMMTGHGVKGDSTILTLPRFAFFYYLILLILITALSLPLDGFQQSTNDRIMSFAVGLFMGWLCGITDWYFAAWRETYYLSEFQERRMLRKQGKTDDEIEKIIQSHRDKNCSIKNDCFGRYK